MPNLLKIDFETARILWFCNFREMNYIVLVKQVPDIKNIPNEAWDWEKGTLKRGLLDLSLIHISEPTRPY